MNIRLRKFCFLFLLIPIHLFAQKSLSKNTVVSDTVTIEKISKRVQSPLLVDIQKTIDSLEQTDTKQLRAPRLYYRLAVMFARAKMYPLALKCFYRSSKKMRANTVDASDSTDAPFANSFKTGENIVQTLQGEAIAVLGDTILVNKLFVKGASKPIKNEDIVQPFNDEKAAMAYGIIVHVKQPSPGKRSKFKLFHGGVGHTFITLIKFNVDGSNVARTFGFYPKKDMLLSATPLFPSTSSDFKNDALHDWDESIGKFIDEKQFHLILNLTRQYAKKKYHLSRNNCTDFGLNIAAVAGIYINHTKGKWPLGSGNDPGDTGQSILENNIATNGDSLLIYNSDISVKEKEEK